MQPSNTPLRDRILAAIDRSLTEVGSQALESFLALPLIENWHPQNMYLSELSKVFNVGLPFSFLVGNITAEKHRQEFGLAICRGDQESSSLSSEVHAGALLRYWGANVGFVPRQLKPTPDIEANWGDEVTLDVEVVRGETRLLHQAVESGIQTFVGVLQPSDISWHVVAYMVNASDIADLTAMFEAATALQPGQSAEDTGKWSVQAVTMDRREEVIGQHSVELFGPKWWPQNEPCYFAVSSLLGTKGSSVVQLRSLVPLTPYTNPILRKANSGQGRPGNPYLIAFDVSDLPHAHERIIEDLNGYFSIWNHVSGALLFEPRYYIGVECMEWLVSMHRNPTATIALPSQFDMLPDQARISIDFKFL